MDSPHWHGDVGSRGWDTQFIDTPGTVWLAKGMPPRPLGRIRRTTGSGNLHAVKKLILALVAAGAGVAVWRKRSSAKPQQQLWAQATDRV